MTNFEQPWFLLLIPIGVIVSWKLVTQKSAIGFSSTQLLEGIKVGKTLLWFEKACFCLFLTSSFLILARPIQSVTTLVPTYKEARDIIFVLDTSTSMSSDKKIGTAVEVISEFVTSRPQDRIALVTFDTKSHLEWPLSADHEPLIFRLSRVQLGGGTKIAGGIITGLEHRSEYGQNSGAIIIVSDGVSEISQAEKNSIETLLDETKLYWILIGREDEKLALEFARFIKGLGGDVYPGEIEQLKEILADISKLEATPVVWEEQSTTTYHFGILPALAVISLLLVGMANVLREV